MKKLLCLAILMAAFIAFPAWASDLVCDANPGIGFYDIEVNGAVVATDVPAEADGSLKWNVDAFTPGNYSFRVRCMEAIGGWPSDWSSPFNATKPGGSLNVRIE